MHDKSNNKAKNTLSMMMTWAGLNNLELQTIRKSLGLDVSEAAEYIGGVSKRAFKILCQGNYLNIQHAV